MGVKHPELVVAGAVVVCLPMVPGLLSGQIGGSTAAERFLIALVVCWLLGSLLSWVTTTYGEQVRRAELTRMIEESRMEKVDADAGPEGMG